MKNNWKFYTNQEGISFIGNTELDEKNYYRMKVFMKNYFKERFMDNGKKQKSLIYSIVMSVYGEKSNEEPYVCSVNIDQRKIDLSWSKMKGLCVAADNREGNCIIRELYKILKESSDNEFWELCT